MQATLFNKLKKQIRLEYKVKKNQSNLLLFISTKSKEKENSFMVKSKII